MAVEQALQSISIEAGADLSAGQYKFVQVATDGQVDLVGSAGADAIGVLQNKPDAAGRAAKVGFSGISKVTLGGTVAMGAKVQSDASGDAILAASGDHVLGTCIKGGAVGEVGEVLLNASHHILA